LFCNNCGKKLPDENARFCPWCGANQKPVVTHTQPEIKVYCPECLKVFDGQQVFCDVCARKVVEKSQLSLKQRLKVR